MANEYLIELSKYYESDKSNRFSKASLADLILFVLGYILILLLSIYVLTSPLIYKTLSVILKNQIAMVMTIKTKIYT